MSEKILIIEDESVLADVLSAKLSKEGFLVEIASDGEEGLKKINEYEPDLILLDIVMPKMNGYEVLENMSKNSIKIPVIIISNSGQRVEIEKTYKLGAVDCIVKTELNPNEVVKKVKNFLNGKANESNKEESAPPASELEENREGETGGGKCKKILLVEDDSFLSDICSKKLLKEGFDVVVAKNGEEALKLTESFVPDLILLDVVIPNINGLEVLKRIRSNEKESIKNIPIIMLTNLGQEGDLKKAMDLGADDYLVKASFTTGEIVEKIKSKLG